MKVLVILVALCVVLVYNAESRHNKWNLTMQEPITKLLLTIGFALFGLGVYNLGVLIITILIPIVKDIASVVGNVLTSTPRLAMGLMWFTASGLVIMIAAIVKPSL
jgi:hypothetical protein